MRAPTDRKLDVGAALTERSVARRRASTCCAAAVHGPASASNHFRAASRRGAANPIAISVAVRALVWMLLRLSDLRRRRSHAPRVGPQAPLGRTEGIIPPLGGRGGRLRAPLGLCAAHSPRRALLAAGDRIVVTVTGAGTLPVTLAFSPLGSVQPLGVAAADDRAALATPHDARSPAQATRATTVFLLSTAHDAAVAARAHDLAA